MRQRRFAFALAASLGLLPAAAHAEDSIHTMVEGATLTFLHRNCREYTLSDDAFSKVQQHLGQPLDSEYIFASIAMITFLQSQAKSDGMAYQCDRLARNRTDVTRN